MENKATDKEIKILIVDDDPSVRNFLVRFLNTKGFAQVLAAENGGDAVKIINSDSVNLVFLDMRLPGANGIDILREIKKINSNIGVIMITGYPEEDAAKEAIKEGAFDYIIKPFDLAYLELSLLTKIVMAT